MASAIGLSLTLSACGGSKDQGSGGSGNRSIVVGTNSIPQTLDPVQASFVEVDFADAALYDKIVDFDPKGELTPRIAQSWEYNSDATQLTLHLRDDATFHSGNPVTASDVVWTLDRAMKVNQGVASYLTAYASSTAPDAKTVVIKLKSPSLAFVNALSKVYVIDSTLAKQHLGNDNGQSWLAQNDAGSGVYKMDSFAVNSALKLSVFDKSWRVDKSRPSTLTFQYVPESATLRDELKAGQISVAAGLSPQDSKPFSSTKGFTLQLLPSMLQRYAVLNNASPVLKDPRVREAVALAYDYQGDISTILQGAGKQATGLVAPGLKCRVELPTVTQDVAKATSLVEQAGAKGATLTVVYQAHKTEHQNVATLLQSNLTKIGLNVKLSAVTYPQWRQMITDASTTPDIAIAYDSPPFPEIGTMLNRIWNSKNINQTNYSRYQNPEVDKLLSEGVASADPDQACQDFQKAQQVINDDHAIVSMVDADVRIAAADNVAGITGNPVYQWFDPTQMTIK